MDVVFLIGRVLFAVVFVFSSFFHFSQPAVDYARAYNAPAPGFMVPFSGAVILVGGLSVALGVLADLGALLLAGFAASIAPIMHAFWKEQDPQTRQAQMAHFMKNLALAGGALVIFYAYNQLQDDAGLSITGPLFE